MTSNCSLLRLQQICTPTLPDLTLTPIAIPRSAIASLAPTKVCVPPVPATVIELTTGRVVIVAEGLQDICEMWSDSPRPYSPEGDSSASLPPEWSGEPVTLAFAG